MPWCVAEVPIVPGALDRMARWSLTGTITAVVGSGLTGLESGAATSQRHYGTEMIRGRWHQQY